MNFQPLPENFVTECGDLSGENTGPKRRRVFIPAIGTLGDVKPFLILACELKKRGYDVRLGVHKRFQYMLEDTGIDMVEIGGDMEAVLSSTPEGLELRRNPSIFNIRTLKTVYSAMFEEWFNAIVSGLVDVDLVVLSLGSLLAVLSCIEKFPTTKAVAIYTFPTLRTSKFSPPGIGGNSESSFGWMNLIKWKMFEYGAFKMHSDKINQLRRRIDLLPMRWNYDQIIQSIFHKSIKTATIYSKYLLPCPNDWGEYDAMVGPILEERLDNFEPPTRLVDVLNEWRNEKVIYVGMGSMMSVMFDTGDQEQFLNKIQTAIRNNNCKAVISLVGFHATSYENLPRTDHIFYLSESIPHCWLLPKMSAAIHHGGAGTTHASVRFGLPTLILSFMADQPFNGDRIFINKLGPKPIPIRQTNTNNLTRAIRDLIAENFSMYSMNAQKIGELMNDEDGLGYCVRIIEAELAGEATLI